MIIKQINLYKVGKFYYSFIRETHFENYILNYIVNKEDGDRIRQFKDCRERIIMEPSINQEIDWAHYLASYIRKYGYTIDVVIEF